MITHAPRGTGARRIPPMTEEEQDLIRRARAGEGGMRDTVVLSLQKKVTEMAARFIHRVSRQTLAFEQGDLIQSANEAMLRRFPLALPKDNPIAYLLRVAKLEMVSYLNGRHGTIRTEPQWQDPISVLSLDRVLQEEVPKALVSCLATDFPLEEPEEEGTYEQLYQAIAQLPAKQRDVIKRHYGLEGYAPISLMQIARELSPDTMSRPKSAHYHHHKALLQLATTLQCDLIPSCAGGVQ